MGRRPTRRAELLGIAARLWTEELVSVGAGRTAFVEAAVEAGLVRAEEEDLYLSCIRNHYSKGKPSVMGAMWIDVLAASHPPRSEVEMPANRQLHLARELLVLPDLGVILNLPPTDIGGMARALQSIFQAVKVETAAAEGDPVRFPPGSISRQILLSMDVVAMKWFDTITDPARPDGDASRSDLNTALGVLNLLATADDEGPRRHAWDASGGPYSRRGASGINLHGLVAARAALAVTAGDGDPIDTTLAWVRVHGHRAQGYEVAAQVAHSLLERGEALLAVPYLARAAAGHDRLAERHVHIAVTIGAHLAATGEYASALQVAEMIAPDVEDARACSDPDGPDFDYILAVALVAAAQGDPCAAVEELRPRLLHLLGHPDNCTDSDWSELGLYVHALIKTADVTAAHTTAGIVLRVLGEPTGPRARQVAAMLRAVPRSEPARRVGDEDALRRSIDTLAELLARRPDLASDRRARCELAGLAQLAKQVARAR